MLSPVAFSMLLKIITLLLAYLQMQLDIINRELEQGINLTPACRAFQVSLIWYHPCMPLQERPIYLALTDPEQRFQREWDATKLEPLAFLFCMPHTSLPLLIKLIHFLDTASLGSSEVAAATICSSR
jgi:hypothetical protein